MNLLILKHSKSKMWEEDMVTLLFVSACVFKPEVCTDVGFQWPEQGATAWANAN